MTLPSGLIVQIAQTAGLCVGAARDAKVEIRCPFHEDLTASAVLFLETNAFFCSAGCGSMGAKAFAERLQVPWSRPEGKAPPGKVEFTPADAKATWKACLETARNDDAVGEHRRVYDFIVRRGLAPALDAGEDLFGLLPRGTAHLPAGAQIFSSSPWRAWDYPLVAPLYDRTGDLVNLQARAIETLPESAPKVLAPKGSHISGSAFANRVAREVLCGEHAAAPVLLGEGLTDYLALASSCGGPVLSAPGSEVAHRIVGPWVRGRIVFVGVDTDRAGEGAAIKVAKEVRKEGGIPLRLKPERKKDWCEVLQHHGYDFLCDFLAWSIERGLKLALR